METLCVPVPDSDLVPPGSWLLIPDWFESLKSSGGWRSFGGGGFFGLPPDGEMVLNLW